MSVIIDRNADNKCFSAFDALKIDYYKSYDINVLYHPVNTHPDMQIHFINKSHAVVAPCAFEYYRSILPERVFLQKGTADPDGTYPGDISYNIAKIGNRIVGNLKYTDKTLLNIYSELGYELINVNQGYAKCNLCIVNENSVITEDEGIYKTLCSKGIDVLKLSSREISLPGFPYGFIGGASGFINDNTIAFLGNIKNHTEYKKIENFVKSKKVNIISLLSTKVADFGSILYF